MSMCSKDSFPTYNNVGGASGHVTITCIHYMYIQLVMDVGT